MADDHAVAHSSDRPGRAPLIPPERYPFYDKLLFAVFVVVVPVFVASNWSVFRDGDVSWHVAAGRWIVENGRVPSIDPFSFTMAGKPWVAFEWGSEVIYWLAYRAAGFAGLATVVATTLMTLSAAIFVYLRPRAGPVALLVTFIVTYLVLQPFIMARPHALAWPFLAAWSALLFHYRDQSRPPPLALAILMFVWANIHGSYFAGFIVAGTAALDALIAAKWNPKIVGRWALFGMVSVAATLLNANGIAGFLHPVSISSMETLPGIAEWHPSTTTNTPVFFVILIVMLGALLMKRPAFRIGELLLLLLTLAMALMHVRHQSVFIVLAALIIPPKLANPGRDEAGRLFGSTAEARAWISAAAVAAIVMLASRTMIPLLPKESFANPRGLLAHAPPDMRSQPVLNEYSLGGPLILAGIRPFIDGRADMYGDDFFKTYMKIADGDLPAFDAVVRKYGISWTMLQTDNRLLPKLDSSPDWKRVYSDRVGVIHVRRGGRQNTPSCNEDPKRENCR